MNNLLSNKTFLLVVAIVSFAISMFLIFFQTNFPFGATFFGVIFGLSLGWMLKNNH